MLKRKQLFKPATLLFCFLLLFIQNGDARPRQLAQSDFPHGLNAPESQDIISGNNRFAFTLFQALRKRQGAEANTIISPFAVSASLELMLNAANGKTYKDLSNTLGVSYHKLEAINQTNADQLKAITKTDLKVEESICNSLFANREVYFKQEFLNIGKQYYNAKIKVEDFGSPDIMPDINNWLLSATSGRMNTIVDSVNINDVFMPLSAVYFRGPWLTPFTDAGRENFQLAGKSTQDAPVMVKTASLPYFKGENFQIVSVPYAIRLPYDENQLSMYVLLPDQGVAFDAFMDAFNFDKFADCLSHMSPANCRITMPRFNATCELNLADALKDLGLGETFDREKADFGKMCFVRVPTCIGQIKHKAVLVVDAEGPAPRKKHKEEPLAASVTMSVDRPFFLAIRDNRTGTLLYIGAICNVR